MFSLFSMEKPPQAALGLPKTPQIYTPTSDKVRRRVITAVAEAVYGEGLGAPFVEHYASDAEAMRASPQSLSKILRTDIREMIKDDFENLGITPESVEQFEAEAKESVKAGASPYKKLSPASTPIKKIGERIARRHGVRLNFVRTSEALEACCTGNIVVVNEKVLKPTDASEEIEWVLEHEAKHYMHGDQKEDIKYKLACEALSPNPKRKEAHKRLCYSHEVSSDLVALEKPELARGYKKRVDFYASLKKADSDSEESDEHPSDRKRQRIASAAIALHAQHKKEQERAKKAASARKLTQ